MEKAISLLGIAVQIAILYALSTNRKKINWTLVAMGIGLQFGFALIILKTTPGEQFFKYMNDIIVGLLGFTQRGAAFVFGSMTEPNIPVGIPKAGPPAGFADLLPIPGQTLMARPG
ncbi:MAG TPA: Na+ dependent nucleoside transporter N-terminal domain-containing protein, partial [Candidatus Ozemobacteraceae bacterium]|nr:Na+ dependent nucleoside transporter N-terminal domain-containing protein [Candidatus Ozemobacteraceae bacterium]